VTERDTSQVVTDGLERDGRDKPPLGVVTLSRPQRSSCLGQIDGLQTDFFFRLQGGDRPSQQWRWGEDRLTESKNVRFSRAEADAIEIVAAHLGIRSAQFIRLAAQHWIGFVAGFEDGRREMNALGSLKSINGNQDEA